MSLTKRISVAATVARPSLRNQATPYVDNMLRQWRPTASAVVVSLPPLKHALPPPEQLCGENSERKIPIKYGCYAAIFLMKRSFDPTPEKEPRR